MGGIYIKGDRDQRDENGDQHKKKHRRKRKSKKDAAASSSTAAMTSKSNDPRVTVFEGNAAREFFLLTFLAAKLNYGTHTEIDHEKWPLPHLNSETMYDKSCKLGIPFHKYHTWVFQELLD